MLTSAPDNDRHLSNAVSFEKNESQKTSLPARCMAHRNAMLQRKLTGQPGMPRCELESVSSLVLLGLAKRLIRCKSSASARVAIACPLRQASNLPFKVASTWEQEKPPALRHLSAPQLSPGNKTRASRSVCNLYHGVGSASRSTSRRVAESRQRRAEKASVQPSNIDTLQSIEICVSRLPKKKLTLMVNERVLV